MVSADTLATPPEAVVVGASAGAIEALNQLLPLLPAYTPFPILVVVHLPPDQPSLLVDIFQPKCALPVREALDKQPVLPGVWFAPPDYHLLVENDRTFALSVDDPVQFSRPSIDVLFQSAVDVYGRGLAALVLTGANRDGAAGAAAVHQGSGRVLVQDPHTAEESAMPLAAIERGAPDLVAPLAMLGRVLRGWAETGAAR